jgi:hypothetical protein
LSPLFTLVGLLAAESKFQQWCRKPQNSHKKKFKQVLKQKDTTPFKNKKNKEKTIVSLVESLNIMPGSAQMPSGSQTSSLQT